MLTAPEFDNPRIPSIGVFARDCTSHALLRKVRFQIINIIMLSQAYLPQEDIGSSSSEVV